MIGSWGGIAAGIFGLPALGGLGGVSFFAQLGGTLLAILYALATGGIVYWILNKTLGLRLSQEEEYRGSDLSVHHIHAYPEDTVK